MQTLLNVFLRESPQWVKSMVQTMGVLVLSSGDSELAVVRAATEGLGLQSILGDLPFR